MAPRAWLLVDVFCQFQTSPPTLSLVREGASGLTQACTQMERGQCDVCVHCLRSIRSWSSMFVSTPGHVVCDVCTHSVIQLWTSSVMPTLRCLSIPSILGTALVRMLCYL